MYLRHWRHLLPIAFGCYLAVAVVSALVGLAFGDLGSVLAGLLGVVAQFWVQGVLVKATEDIRDGRADLSARETVSAVLPRFGRIAGVSAVIALVAIGLGAAVGILTLAAGAAGFLIGLVGLIAAVLYLLIRWIAVVPVIVLEDADLMDSFRRSGELVDGYRWNVCGVVALTLLILIGFGIALGLVLSPLDRWLEELISNIVSGTLAAPFVALAWTLVYYRMREVKARGSTMSADALV